MMTLEELNGLSEKDAKVEFLRCCGANRWASEMITHRPFGTRDELLSTANEVWQQLDQKDWKEAFSRHPKIGDIENLKKKFARPPSDWRASTAQWAQGEQSGVAQTSERVLKELAEGNNLYEAKFGYIFIVCATAKSADEMLEMLNLRLKNTSRSEERRVGKECRL